MIKFQFCYKSSFCSPILKLSIFKCSSVTKVQFVHPYQKLHFWCIHQISISLKEFNLFTHIEVCNFQIFVWFIHLLQKFNFFTHIKTCIFEIFLKFVHLLKKFNLFTSIKPCTYLIFIKIVLLLQKFNLFTRIETYTSLNLWKQFIC